MKNFIVLLFVVAGLSACGGGDKIVGGEKPNPPMTSDVAYFGVKINESGAQPVSEIKTLMQGKDSLKLKLRGMVLEACQNKGCWMKMDIGNGESMRVKFHDYKFFVPKESGGHEAIIEGWAFRKIISVDELRHYAEDAGKSSEEIAKITAPKEEITFYANGVIMKTVKVN